MLNAKKQCFALKHIGSSTTCDCLKDVTDCSNCNFYKTKKEYNEKVAPLIYKEN